VRRLDAHRVEWVVLAGFMRVLTEVVLERFPDRVVNIHPALLPAFPGLDGQGQALRAGVKIAGCTVHLVDAGVDTGPILAQTAVPVLPDDTEDTLRDRILAEEHALLPAVVRALAEGRLERAGGRAWLRGAAGAGALRSGLP
jgi:phosphoribosylglycinamide formyltransferase-1